MLALRQAVGQSDALLIACPEYAHGVPGAFKNLLDWLVGGLEFPGRPVALLNTSVRDSHHAQAALREVLITMSAVLIEPACITVPLSGAGCEMENILLVDDRVIEVHQCLEALSQALSAA
ncbi:MAG: NAD(P)H-dependent oxidoreductase [Rhodanobacter sp.]